MHSLPTNPASPTRGFCFCSAAIFKLLYSTIATKNSEVSFVKPSTSVGAAFFGVVLIWSTTPLGIKWSGEEGISFLFGLTARMFIGCLLALIVVAVLRLPYNFARKSVLAYGVSALGIYVAMLCAYWGARYIPSGWVAVIWGTSSVFTGVLARQYLGEQLSLTSSPP